VEGITQIN